MANWFTADPHFGHANIIKYCKRPFAHVGEMDTVLTAEWNRVVQPNDTIYILGDMTFMRPDDAIAQIKRLNGKKILISGNHDAYSLKDARFRGCFEFTTPALEAKFDDPECKGGSRPDTMYHYCQRVWNKRHHGAFHAYGHSHATLPRFRSCLDVGVDSAAKLLGAYRPFSWEEFRAFCLEDIVEEGPQQTYED